MTRQQYDNWISHILGDENGSTVQAVNQMNIVCQSRTNIVSNKEFVARAKAKRRDYETKTKKR